MEYPIFIIVALIIVATIVGRFVRDRKRRKQTEEQAQQLAQSRGWRYVESDIGILDSYSLLPPLSGEDSGGSRNQFDARHVIFLTAGDYPGHSFTHYHTANYTDSDGDSKRDTSRKHVVGLELPVPFPNVTIRSRRRSDRVFNKLNKVFNTKTKPVEFPMEEFNAAYTVHSEHPPAALEIITTDTARWLIEQDLKDEIVLQDHLIVIYKDGYQQVENIDSMLAVLTGLLTRVPQEAWQKAQGEYPRPKRYHYSDAVNLNKIADAVKDYRSNN